jgi:23S rRNA (cytosine1962-C5)-methyltransferase
LSNPGAALAVRIYTRTPGQALDGAFFAARAAEAVRFRMELFRDRPDTDAYRVVFSEADGLSGVVIDRYADAISAEIEAGALVPHLGPIFQSVVEAFKSTRLAVKLERNAALREGLVAADVEKHAFGEPGPVTIRESGFVFEVRFEAAQKTGFYLDQRENRRRVAAYARDRRVLSAYCYTGAFEVHCAAAGARGIVGLDSSEPALELARRHHVLNALCVPADYRCADVPTALRSLRDAGETFDMVILDPPRFVANRSQKERGMRAYKDINLLAVKLLTPGGILATFSCSGLVTAADFRKIIGWASADAGRTVRILETLGQPPDHPVLAVAPETEYLKGLICRVE